MFHKNGILILIRLSFLVKKKSTLLPSGTGAPELATRKRSHSPLVHIFKTFCFCLFLQVAAAMGEFCLLNRCDFVVSTGDNMYNDGVDSPFDEKFDSRWKDMYSHPSIAQLTW